MARTNQLPKGSPLPRIFDNIDLTLLPHLKQTLDLSNQADFCVKYRNLRGSRQIDTCIELWTGTEDNRCCLLVGIQHTPKNDFNELFTLAEDEPGISNRVAVRLKKRLAEPFREQLTQ